ncbi:hypothetical protein EON83_23930 [bacterium]|nr:MAG: hypothetical protein EON83_23930 [bacterium]
MRPTLRATFMKRWILVPLLSASLIPLLSPSAKADDLNARAAQIKSQLQTQWLPTWSKTSTANELAGDAALNLQTLSYAHRMGYTTPSLNLLEAASAHYKLLRDSRRDKANDGFYSRSQDSKEPVKSTLLQAQAVEALVEYARASGEAEPRGLAVKIWRLIRDKGRDKIHGGYYDSIYSVQATPTSATAFGSKSALTHLALLQAATGLYDLTRDRSIRTDLAELLDLNAGRFFSVRPEDRGWVYSWEWQLEQPSDAANPAVMAATPEAGAAIVRAQTVLELPIGWVELARRTDFDSSNASSATVSALIPLTKTTSNREGHAARLDTILDSLKTSSAQVPVGNGIPLLDFVAAFEK